MIGGSDRGTVAATLRGMNTPKHTPAYRLDDLTRPTGKRRRSRVGLIIGVLAAVVVLLAGGLVLALVVRDSGTSSDAPPIAGCTVGTTEEIYVQTIHNCPDGTRVLTFASEQARDDYLKIATHFGAVVVEQGETWARIRV